MLFKEKLLLSNCDSVRALNEVELRKRILAGIAYADGIVMSPNALIDNAQIASTIGQANVMKYLNEEGWGKFIIRGFGLEKKPSLIEYYDSLPDNHIFSSLPNRPTKGSLDKYAAELLRGRIRSLQAILDDVCPVIENLNLPSESLRDEIVSRLQDPACIGPIFESDGERQLFCLGGIELYSRSAWYTYANQFFLARGTDCFPRFKLEVIDPSYNSLFAAKNEGFLQDNIRFLTGLPDLMLDTSIGFKALRKEIELIQYPLKIFEFITSAGAGELARFLTNEAVGFIEDKLIEGGHGYATRKNWFGMYPKMRRYMGLEIK